LIRKRQLLQAWLTAHAESHIAPLFLQSHPAYLLHPDADLLLRTASGIEEPHLYCVLVEIEADHRAHLIAFSENGNAHHELQL
jgi:hypothetical protein